MESKVFLEGTDCNCPWIAKYGLLGLGILKRRSLMIINRWHAWLIDTHDDARVPALMAWYGTDPYKNAWFGIYYWNVWNCLIWGMVLKFQYCMVPAFTKLVDMVRYGTDLYQIAWYRSSSIEMCKIVSYQEWYWISVPYGTDIYKTVSYGLIWYWSIPNCMI